MKKVRIISVFLGLLPILLMCTWAGAASFISPTPFAISGSDNPGAYILTGAMTFMTTTVTLGPTTPVAASPAAGPWVSGSWMAPTSNQSWPMNPNPSGYLPGTYTYTTTFNLAGFNSSTAVLGGNWAADDSGQLYLNGKLVADTGNNSYSALSSFSIQSGFLPGVNTLSFKVANNPYADSLFGINPTGLLVNFTQHSASPASAPIPATLWLLGFGITALLGLRKKL